MTAHSTAKPTPQTEPQHLPTKLLVKQLWHNYLAQHKWSLSWAVVAMIIVAGCTAGQAKLIQPALDFAMQGQAEQYIWLIGGAFFGVSVLKGTFNYIQMIVMMRIGYGCIETIQNQMFAKLMASDTAYLDHIGTGKQISRFTSDVHILRDTTTKVFVGFGKQLFTLIFLFSLCLSINPTMTFVAFFAMPALLVPITRIGLRIRRMSRASQEEMGIMNSVVDDALKGIQQVKSYNRQEYEQARAGNSFQTLREISNKIIRRQALFFPILEIFMGLTLAGMVTWGGFMVYNGTATIGSFMAFFVAVIGAYQPIRALANLNTALQQGLAATQRIFELLQSEPTITDTPNAKTLSLKNGAVKFDNVHFAYNADSPVVQGLTLNIPAKKTVAIVGESGSGKSTLLSLIGRFYDVTNGTITIDGQDIRTITQHSLRDNIATVTQDTWLFNGTIADNIRYGKLDATDDEIINACKIANAHDFIMKNNDGYQTMVGERGMRLSGGQRQRIAIARAVLKDAPILLLDEATSALDTESERKVQDALETLMQNRTTIIVAHRLTTIQNADTIHVMEHGKLAESGTHTELLKKKGAYYKLNQQKVV